ncbi:hypothetical protein DPMN_152813 [Dreissena polymorpha]|uniref:Uncharacterized protein n=1 Tax=Dreissena polymorpha TaxID=45954 RepID=A0A9D4J8Q5_DREPO|nr:hypothetical protein DPMN_152813 [Dreissena polymorpha]
MFVAQLNVSADSLMAPGGGPVWGVLPCCGYMSAQADWRAPVLAPNTTPAIQCSTSGSVLT